MGTVLFADGLEDAFLGIGSQVTTLVAVYDLDKVQGILEHRGLSSNEAAEWIEYNIIQAYVGPQTPVFLRRSTLESAQALIREYE